VALGLGGNLGDAEAALTLAIARLAAALGPLEIAALYRSSPVSPIAQPAFLNTAVLAHTALAPEEVLAIAKQIELAAHRRRRERWGPRELDIDLLLFGDQQRQQPELTLPHPQLRQRRFVLTPLADLAPDWPIPPDGAHVAQLLAQAPLSGTVERIPWSR
jgi:2-amino-4-hydroxy-6-hydroxymethyldihydropteridine diphosphokinase